MVRPGLAASHVADDARIVIEESQVISAFGILREAFGMFDYGRSRGVLPLRALAVLGEYALPGADVAPIATMRPQRQRPTGRTKWRSIRR